MAYFAFEGGVSTSPADGSVGITEQQYADALAGVMSGQEVTIDGGFAIRDPKPTEHHVWRDGEWIDETPVPEPEPEPVLPPKLPQVFATAKLTINSGVMEGFAVDSRVAGGFQIDTGYFMLILSEPITSEYIVSAFDGGMYRLYVKPEDYAEDYFIVTCTNLHGNMADPDNISVVIITTE